MYAEDAKNERPERPGVNRLGLTQILNVDSTIFDDSVRCATRLVTPILHWSMTANRMTRAPLTSRKKFALHELFSDDQRVLAEPSSLMRATCRVTSTRSPGRSGRTAWLLPTSTTIIGQPTGARSLSGSAVSQGRALMQVRPLL